jgi:hypothetical protein
MHNTAGVLERLSPYAAHARKAATAAQAERKEKRAELITERRTQAKVCVTSFICSYLSISFQFSTVRDQSCAQLMSVSCNRSSVSEQSV